MGERIVATAAQEIDLPFVSRLLIGGQTEHEQRLVAVRLLRHDAAFRAAMAAPLAHFEVHDRGFAAEYEAVLTAGGDVGTSRDEILARARRRAPDLDRMIDNFTYGEIFTLGQSLRYFFSWTMAEHLLERASRPGASEYRLRTSLYLALMVIDAIEMLGAAGLAPEFPAVVRDVRRRLAELMELFGQRTGEEEP